jgi:hypothetical protein
LSIKDKQKDSIKVQDRQEKKMFTDLNLLQYNVTNCRLVWPAKRNLFGKWFYLNYRSLLSSGHYNTLISIPLSWVEDFTFTFAFQPKVLKMSSGASD